MRKALRGTGSPLRRRGATGRRGDQLVEFTLAVSLFLLLVFGVIELGRWYFIRETLENAVRQAGRYAVTGNHSSTNSRYASIQQVAQNAAIGITPLIIDIRSVAGGTNNAGGPGDIVKISMTTTVNFLYKPIAGYFKATGSNSTFTVSATFRNEHFPGGS